MIAVLQRVSAASVTVEGDTNVAVESDTNVAVESDTNVAVESDTKAEIGAGFVALVGVRKGDDEHAAERLARKVATLRVFGDERGRFNRDILHPLVQGEILAVSQFTLLADCRRGRRPGFDAAESPERASALFDHFVAALRSEEVAVKTGAFGAVMRVALVNEGPVTIILDTDKLAGPR